jgi:hypothetical protein
MDTKEFATMFSRFINNFNCNIEGLVDILSREHRSLQQGITRFAVAWLEKMAEFHDEKNFDLRNEASAKLGKEFVEKVSYEARKGVPFI